MPTYSVYAVREQRVLVIYEAPDYKSALSYIDEQHQTLELEKMPAGTTVTVEETLDELYGVDKETLEVLS